MKKNYFFGAILLLLIMPIQAQVMYETSFESEENFTLNSLEGQNGWLTNPNYSSLIVITDEESSDGNQSLHFQADPNGPIPGGSITGAGTSFPTITGDFSFSMDILIEAGDGVTDSEFNIFLQDGELSLLTARIAFFDGNILVVNTNPADPNTFTFQNAGSYTPGEWFEFEVDFSPSDDQITYAVNDDIVFTGDIIATETVNQFLFFSSFNQTGAYIDDIKLEVESLSTNSPSVANFSIYPNPATNVLHIQPKNNATIQKFSIIQMDGKQQQAELIDNTINVSGLPTGTYMLQLQTELGNETLRFIKK